MLQSNFAVYLKNVLEFGPMGIGWILFTVGVMACMHRSGDDVAELVQHHARLRG